MSALSIVLMAGALVAVAGGIALARSPRVSVVYPALLVGLALCAYFEAGRQWTA